MRRLTQITGLIPVEYSTTRRTSTPKERAQDLNEAFADPSIRAVLAVIGGEDQITVIPHLDDTLIVADPKPFLGYSDNTNILNWLWNNGVAGFYGGSTHVHLGPGPAVDRCHAASLRAALLTGERIQVTEPGMSEDVGKPWDDPAALTEFGDRQVTEPWTWAGPARSVTGPTWGGCVEVIQWILTAGRFPQNPHVLNGGVLLLETSEELIPAREFGWILRSLGERGVLSAIDAVLVARPPASDLAHQFSRAQSASHRAARARYGNRDRGRLQPRSCRLCRASVRTHPAAMDPSLRWRHHRRWNNSNDLGRLQLIRSQLRRPQPTNVLRYGTSVLGYTLEEVRFVACLGRSCLCFSIVDLSLVVGRWGRT